MGITNRKNSIYAKKILFNELLTKDLCNSAYLINAEYQWKKPSCVFSFSIKNDSIQLCINLNCMDDNLFFSDDRGIELVVRYRAYFISNYIRCLEAVWNTNPQSYFNGLVDIEAINALHEKKVESYSPLSKSWIELRPIDIHCAIRALTRLLFECGNWIPCDVKQYCETQIDSFIVYSQLPEIEYHERTPMYSLQVALKTLHNNLLTGKIRLQQYSIFSDNNMCVFEDMLLDGFIGTCSKSGNPFWAGVAIRLIAFSGIQLDSSFSDSKGFLSNYVMDFQQSCIRYSKEYRGYSSRLTTDNFEAIKRIAQCVERTVHNTFTNAGALHYIQ